MILLGEEPGIGKSTLMLQLALSIKGCKTLYVLESDKQIKMRAEREKYFGLLRLTETSTQNIFLTSKT